MNRISPPSPPPDYPEGPEDNPATGQGTVPADGRSAALDADLGELILLIGRIRRDLDGGNPLHCPDMKPLARRAERIVGLLPQLPRAEAQPLLPRLERVMRELDAVEERLRSRRSELDRALDQAGASSPPNSPPGQGRR
ncbi:hypothetical protein ACFOGJ_09105 [Marinibaculum pumilum]|uniref:Uncharacterized protein n=1 Tax=Marinibaculum pumilum TaxID=1766165 RepID=A0ABV7KYA2_9PROT